jgi:hypothetical protein
MLCSGERTPLLYLSEALGLGYTPSAFLWPVTRPADVLVGGIDYPAAHGRRAVNMLLASALTDWHVRVKQIERPRSWQALEAAERELRPVSAHVVGQASKGLRVRVFGLNALLPVGQMSSATHRPTSWTRRSSTDSTASLRSRFCGSTLTRGKSSCRSASHTVDSCACPWIFTRSSYGSRLPDGSDCFATKRLTLV